NTTAATSGNPQYSPMLELLGQGFSGASHTDKMAWQVQPSGAADSANMSLQQSMNGAAYSTAVNIDINGNYNTPNNSSSLLITNSSNVGFWATSTLSVLYVGGTNVVNASTNGFQPSVDGLTSLGLSGQRWGGFANAGMLIGGHRSTFSAATF